MALFKTQVPPLWGPRCHFPVTWEGFQPSHAGAHATLAQNGRHCSIGPATQLLCSPCAAPWEEGGGAGGEWGRAQGSGRGEWGEQENGEGP